MVAHIQELEDMDASEFHARRLNAKEVLTRMKGDSFPGRRWNSQKLLEEIDIVLDEEKNKKFFEENQTNSLLQTLFKMTQHGTMRKPKSDVLVFHGRFQLSPSRGIQSQTVHAERRIISYSDEVHPRYQNNTYVT